MTSTTSTSTPTIPPSLSLPPSQFARLQPHAYLLAHLSPPASIASTQSRIRANGRLPVQFRTTSANTGSLTHINGSAVVRLGDTAAVCGVRAEILHTDDIPSWGLSLSSSSSSYGNSSISRKRRKKTRPLKTPLIPKGMDSMQEDDDDDDDDDEDNEEEQDEDENKGDILTDSQQIRSLNLLVPNLSLSTGCAPGFIPGAPPSSLAQSLSHQLLLLLHTSRLIRADDLQIWYHPPNLSTISEEGKRTKKNKKLPRHNEGEEENVDDAMSIDSEFDSSPTKSNNGGNSVHNDNDLDNTASVTNSEIKAFWVLYIDVMIIGLAGNAFDAAWMSVLAALRDTRLPHAWWDVDSETVLCSDEVASSKKLSLRGLPVACSFAVFEGDAAVNWRPVVIPNADKDQQQSNRNNKNNEHERWILADPDGFEESLCEERVCIVLDRTDQNNQGQKGMTKIVSMEKTGGMAVGKDELRHLVSVSEERWVQVKNTLDSVL